MIEGSTNTFIRCVCHVGKVEEVVICSPAYVAGRLVSMFDGLPTVIFVVVTVLPGT